jgi:hypothetical protein
MVGVPHICVQPSALQLYRLPSMCGVEHRGTRAERHVSLGGLACREPQGSHDAPCSVAGSTGELTRQGSPELGQHQVDGLWRDLQELGSERHRHQWTRQEQLDQLRQLGVGAGLGCDPAHQLMGENKLVEILVGDGHRLLERLAEALPPIDK